MRDVIDTDVPCQVLSQPSALRRGCNRQRAKATPDISVARSSEDRRHITFATTQQLDLLSRAKGWHVDGTIRLVKAPFTQLTSVHAFIKSGDEVKQVSLVFTIMSGAQKADYKGIYIT